MNLYLVQHAQARSEEEDPTRSLSDKGLADIGKVAAFAAANCGFDGVRIFHSGKRRAEQTAAILAAALKSATPQKMEGLAPLDDPRIWVDRLRVTTEDIMLVGHLPHMARLAAMLLGEDRESVVVKFQMGCILALGRVEAAWSVQWMIVPAIVPGSQEEKIKN